jgi:hypothetical protein
MLRNNLKIYIILLKRISKRVLEWKTTGRRIRGRPRKRWIEDSEEDIQLMGIRG